MDNLALLFDVSDFPPRWHCGNWSDLHGWIHIVADSLIFGAYMAIPIAIAVVLSKRRGFGFPRVSWLFAGFIAFCGTAHLVEAIIFWAPIYRFAALCKVATAAVSWLTVVALVPTTRKLMTLKSPQELEREVQRRTAELAAEKATLNGVFACVGPGVLVVDASHRLVMYNPAAARMLGVSASHASLESWAASIDIYDRDGRAVGADELSVARVMRYESVEDEHLVVNGRTFSVSARRIDWSATSMGAVAVFTDISETAALQAELFRSNHHLNEYARVISHDLREPIRHMRSFSELLLTKNPDNESDERQRYLRYIIEGSGRADRMVKGMLEQARLRTRMPNPSIVDLKSVVEDVAAGLGPTIEDKGADIDIGPLEAVSVDEIQLRQVVQNILQNALKYSLQHATVRIRGHRKSDHYQISIQDNGIGIPQEHQSRIFGMFERLHANEEVPGDGMGLSICKTIVENWGGHIWVESTPGYGSTFHFTIPVHPLEPTLSPSGPAMPQA